MEVGGEDPRCQERTDPLCLMEVGRLIQNMHRRIAVLISEAEQQKAMIHRRLGVKRPLYTNSIGSRHRGQLFDKAEAEILWDFVN